MEYSNILPAGDFILLSMLAIIALVGAFVGFVRLIDHWAFERALKDWTKQNPKAAPIFNAIHDGSYWEKDLSSKKPVA